MPDDGAQLVDHDYPSDYGITWDDVARQAIADIQGILNNAQSDTDVFLPQLLADDILAEIPTSDPTYTAVGARLEKSKAGFDIEICPFKTFNGALAFQPCISNPHQLQLFDALIPLDAGGDVIFKEARTWACIVQSSDDLPRPCRWLAATVYNFASEVLRPENNEDHLWRMRAWLHHWYDVAQSLFEQFNISLQVPEPDWFQRPTMVQKYYSYDKTHGTECNFPAERYLEVSSGSGETVLHHVLSPSAPEFTCGSLVHPSGDPSGWRNLGPGFSERFLYYSVDDDGTPIFDAVYDAGIEMLD